jgi:methionyl-tRNA formyltransferase
LVLFFKKEHSFLKLAFLGSPAFSVPALHALHAAGHEILRVYSQPPRPAGRGHAVMRSPVHAAAEAMGLTVRTPARVRRDEAEHAAFAALDLDAAVVVAYGLILPAPMLNAPRLGCINIHASLLPRWRGAAPIQAAILAGDRESGVTIMRMDEGLDTGPMLLRGVVPITARTTAPDLHDALSGLGARLIVQALADMPPAVPQPEAGATYAAKLSKDDGRIDWRRDAASLDRQVRALNPWPGTFGQLGAETIKVLAAHPVAGSGPAGKILDPQLTVACGAGALRLDRVQRPGRPAMSGADLLRGIPGGLRLILS